jgi:hypothetical protein
MWHCSTLLKWLKMGSTPIGVTCGNNIEVYVPDRKSGNGGSLPPCHTKNQLVSNTNQLHNINRYVIVQIICYKVKTA